MTEYKSVSWGEEPVVVEKLHQMATNDQALFEMKPSTAIKHVGANRNKGMKILAGSQLFQPSGKWNQNVTIYFGNYFSAGCSPIILAQHYGAPQTGMNTAVKGIGNTKVPDHRGFMCYVWTADRLGNKGTLQQPFYIAYIAVGF